MGRRVRPRHGHGPGTAQHGPGRTGHPPQRGRARTIGGRCSCQCCRRQPSGRSAATRRGSRSPVAGHEPVNAVEAGTSLPLLPATTTAHAASPRQLPILAVAVTSVTDVTRSDMPAHRARPDRRLARPARPIGGPAVRPATTSALDVEPQRAGVGEALPHRAHQVPVFRAAFPALEVGQARPLDGDQPLLGSGDGTGTPGRRGARARRATSPHLLVRGEELPVRGTGTRRRKASRARCSSGRRSPHRGGPAQDHRAVEPVEAPCADQRHPVAGLPVLPQEVQLAARRPARPARPRRAACRGRRRAARSPVQRRPALVARPVNDFWVVTGGGRSPNTARSASPHCGRSGAPRARREPPRPPRPRCPPRGPAPAASPARTAPGRRRCPPCVHGVVGGRPAGHLPVDPGTPGQGVPRSSTTNTAPPSAGT